MILITSISQFPSYLIICTLLETIMYHINTGVFNWIYGAPHLCQSADSQYCTVQRMFDK